MKKTSLVVALAMATAAVPALARNCNRTVQFQRGTHSATLSGTLAGYQTCDYRLNVRDGQELRVWVSSRKPIEAMHMVDADGSPMIDGEPVVVDADGYQTIRVAMSREGARRNPRPVPYTIKLDVR